MLCSSVLLRGCIKLKLGPLEEAKSLSGIKRSAKKWERSKLLICSVQGCSNVRYRCLEARIEAGRWFSPFNKLHPKFARSRSLLFGLPEVRCEQRSAGEEPTQNQSHEPCPLVFGRHLLGAAGGPWLLRGLGSSFSQHALFISHQTFRKIILKQTKCKWELCTIWSN